MRCSARSFVLASKRVARGGVGARVGAAARRALDRLRLDRAVAAHAQEALGRGAEDRALAHPQVRAVGAGLQRRSARYSSKLSAGGAQVDAVREADLVALAGLEQAPACLDVRHVVLAPARELKLERRARRRRRRAGPGASGSRASAAAVASAQRRAGVVVAAAGRRERKHVRLAALVIERDDAVGEQQERVGQLRAVRVASRRSPP